MEKWKYNKSLFVYVEKQNQTNTRAQMIVQYYTHEQTPRKYTREQIVEYYFLPFEKQISANACEQIPKKSTLKSKQDTNIVRDIL
ncbi:hypothetical protein DNU06_02550 [Putridiphycobacter roseus]|uniref:Uncharacterized protein n=1 Tax=Putridiphycobacter roseus TaxID=2219161 RepID=A0A2W1N331_9FLAO|nr:hypothetical protein DNU06_02550 [Putridiphycobacter roseus]